MKIDNSIKPATAPPSSAIKAPQNTGSVSTPAVPSDEVKLSPLAGQLQVAELQPPVDRARIQEIKQAIAEGRFSINAGAIADKLVDSAREILNSQRKA